MLQSSRPAQHGKSSGNIKDHRNETKHRQGELFPENMLQDPAMVQNGKVTDAGMALLRQKLPHIDFTTFDKDRNVKSLSEVFTVKSLCDFLERKLAK
jgi:hypothetical protein